MNSLLFKNMTLPMEEVDHPILSAPTKELFEFLRQVDPEQASRMHPSDRRKIETRVKLYLSSGKPATELFKQQKDEGGGGLQTRWDTLVFWVWSERDVLNERLDSRVDKMISQGAEQECRDLYDIAQRTGSYTDNGIFQTIGPLPPSLSKIYCSNVVGYPEFVPVIEAHENDVDKARQQAIEAMKVSTRQYVKTQLKWIKSKLLPLAHNLGTKHMPIYILDATDPTQWSTKVLRPALTAATGPPLPNTHNPVQR
jgi:tRNA dimethylallyltransferase